MAASENHTPKGIRNHGGEPERKSQVALVSQGRPKSEELKFGAWEGGENYTGIFDNAQKIENNGQMINQNDPEENPAMFLQNGGPAQTPRTDPIGKQSNVPQFGAWDNGDNIGYTVYFDKKQKTKNGENVPQTNRDIHPPAQAHPQPVKQEARPQLNRDVSKLPAKEGRSKVPQFGAWNEGENCAYTVYFNNARMHKNERSLFNMARSPLLDEDMISERTRHLPWGDYGGGGGRRLSVEPIGNSGNATRGFPASTVGSKTPLLKKTKLLQLWHMFHKKSGFFFKKATSVPRGN